MSHLKHKFNRNIKDDFREYEEEEYDMYLNDMSTRCIRAVKTHNLSEIKRLLECGLDPNMLDDDREPLLNVVVSKIVNLGKRDKNLEILELLLFFGARADERNRLGQTALHIAAETSHEALVTLLRAGACVNTQDVAGITPLMAACINHHDDAVAMVYNLLDHNANLSSTDMDGYTALHIVCKNHHQSNRIRAEIVNILLEHGASANVRDKLGRVPLCYELENILKANVTSDEGDFFVVLDALLQATPVLSRRGQMSRQQFSQLCLQLGNDRSATVKALQGKFRDVISVSAAKNLKQCLPRDKEAYGDLWSSVDSMTKYVHSLKSLCRLGIRGTLYNCSGNIYNNVKHLPLPSSIQSYLLYQ